MARTKTAAIKAHHNSDNAHENKGVGCTRPINRTLRYSAASTSRKSSILLRNVLDEEEGISDKIHPSTENIENKTLNQSSETKLNKHLSAKKLETIAANN